MKGNPQNKNLDFGGHFALGGLGFLVGLLFILMASPSLAGSVYCTNCSTKWTQTMDRATNLQQLARLSDQLVQEISQTEQQIRMVQQNIERYQNMVQNTQNLGPEVLTQLSGEYRRLGNLYSEIETRRGDLEAMRRAYKDMYPSYGDLSDEQGGKYQQRWQTWSAEVDRANRATLEQSGRQLKDLQEADSYDSNIQQLLNSPQGRMEAIQAGNQLTAIQLQEARELRALMATSLQEQAAVNAKREKVEQAREEQYQRLFKPRETPVNPHNAKGVVNRY